MAFRFITLILIFGASYGLLGFNLYKLQVLKSDYFFQRVQAGKELLAELTLRRGGIFFTDRAGGGIAVALNKDYPIVYAVPKEIEDSKGAAKALAPIIGMEEGNLSDALSNKKSLFKLLLDKKATPEQISSVLDLKIKGIYSDKKQYRFYPFEELASQLIGYVGLNEENDEPAGLYGIEKMENSLLKEGDEIRLTIDRNLQAHSEKILKELIEKFNAEAGTVIIEDPKTGKILTLANFPTFDPNDYSKSSVKNFLNQAVQYMYEPGSVFKPLTMASGIDAGVFTPETTFFDSGSVTLNGKKITNWDKKAYGEATMTNVIEHSINTGAVFAESKIGNKLFYSYLKKFGFGEKTGIDLPDEVSGDLRNLENKNAHAIDYATASFGQGTAVTPIQLISAFSSIANGGLLMRPYVHADSKPYILKRVIKEDTAKKVTAMMESAVTKAKIAAIPQYRVAGKTGTAQIPEGGGYSELFIHSYVGFAPASDPKFVILLKLDKPEANLAGETVVPAFRELAQYVLNYYNVPPDDIFTDSK